MAARLLAAALLLFATLTAAAQTTGNVGIGTTAPTQTLDVNGSLRVRGLGGSDLRLTQVQPDGTLGASAPLPGLSTLDSPIVVSTTPAQPQPTGIALGGGYAYVANGAAPKGIQVFSLADPDRPAALPNPVSGGAGLDLMTLAGNYLYVCDLAAGTLRTYTLASPGTPTQPSFVGLVTAPSPAGVAVSGNFLYVANIFSNTVQRLTLAGAGSPAAPANLGTTPCTRPSGPAVRGNYLYVAHFLTGSAGVLETFQIDPATGNLTSLGTVAAGNMPNNVAVEGNYLYVSVSGDNQIRVYSLANPAAPVQVGVTNVAAAPFGLAVLNGRGYLTNNGASSLQVVRLTAPNVVSFGSDGQLTSVASSLVGDDLGNHAATQNLNLATYLLVGQASGGTAPSTTGLRIDGAGQVGIGTSTPVAPLDVQAGTALSNTATGTETQLRLTRPGTSGSKWNSSAELAVGTYAAGINSQSQLDFRLGNGGNAAADQTVLTLRGDGSVLVPGKVTTPATGAANLLAASYGNVYGAGTLYNAPANVTVTHAVTGEYLLSFTGPLATADLASLAVSLTLFNGPGFSSFSSGGGAGKLLVRTFNTAGTLTDRGFSFVVFQP